MTSANAWWCFAKCKNLCSPWGNVLLRTLRNHIANPLYTLSFPDHFWCFAWKVMQNISTSIQNPTTSWSCFATCKNLRFPLGKHGSWTSRNRVAKHLRGKWYKTYQGPLGIQLFSLSYFATCEGLCFPQGKHDCNMAESCWRTHISLVVAWSCFNAWRERWRGTYREPLGIQHFLGCVSRRAKTIVSLRGNMLFERGEVP